MKDRMMLTVQSCNLFCGGDNNIVQYEYILRVEVTSMIEARLVVSMRIHMT